MRKGFASLLILVLILAIMPTHLASAAVPALVWSKEFTNSPFTFSSPIPLQANGGATDIIIGGTAPFEDTFAPSNARVFDGSNGSIIRTLDVPANSFSVADVDGD